MNKETYNIKTTNQTQLDRVKEAVKYLKQIGIIRFEKELSKYINYNPQVINRIMNRGQGSNSSFVIDFARAFADFFYEDYILHGNGVLIKEKTEKIEQEEKSNNVGKITAKLFEQLEAKDKVISFLSEQIKEKDKEIERLHLLIERLTPSKINKENNSKKTINV